MFNGSIRLPLTPIQAKVLADLVAGAGRPEEAFIQEEIPGDKARELWLTADPVLQLTQPLPLVFAVRQSDVRLVGTSLIDEPAICRRRNNAPLKQKQFMRDLDVGKENPGAIEAAQFLKPYRNGPQVQLVQLRHDAFVLFAAGIAQEFERDVPRSGRRPAKPVPAGSKPRRDRRKFGDHCVCQRNPNKEAHEEIIQGARQVAQQRKGTKMRRSLWIPAPAHWLG